jgi:hypothetical protein
MLCSQNSGKYVSGNWHEDRYLAEREIDNFDSDDQSFLETTDFVSGIIGKLDRFDRDMTMMTIPVDPNGEAEEYDYRDNPEVGH